MTTESWWLVG